MNETLTPESENRLNKAETAERLIAYGEVKNTKSLPRRHKLQWNKLKKFLPWCWEEDRHIPTSTTIASTRFPPSGKTSLGTVLQEHFLSLVNENKASKLQMQSKEPFNAAPNKPLPPSINWCQKNFLPLVLVPSFLDHYASRDGNQISRAFRYHSDCVEKIQDGESRWNFRKFERICSYSCVDNEEL